MNLQSSIDLCSLLFSHWTIYTLEILQKMSIFVSNCANKQLKVKLHTKSVLWVSVSPVVALKRDFSITKGFLRWREYTVSSQAAPAALPTYPPSIYCMRHQNTVYWPQVLVTVKVLRCCELCEMQKKHIWCSSVRSVEFQIFINTHWRQIRLF